MIFVFLFVSIIINYLFLYYMSILPICILATTFSLILSGLTIFPITLTSYLISTSNTKFSQTSATTPFPVNKIWYFISKITLFSLSLSLDFYNNFWHFNVLKIYFYIVKIYVFDYKSHVINLYYDNDVLDDGQNTICVILDLLFIYCFNIVK